MGAQLPARWRLRLGIYLVTQAALYFLLKLYLFHFCPLSPCRPQALWEQGRMTTGTILGLGEPAQCWAGKGAQRYLLIDETWGVG